MVDTGARSLCYESYLLGQLFGLKTDHRNLVYMTEATAPMVIRWRLRLQEYNFQIVHIPGITNEAADALSRVNCAAFAVLHGLRRSERGGSVPAVVPPPGHGSEPAVVPPSSDLGNTDSVSSGALAGEESSTSLGGEELSPGARVARVHNAVCGHHAEGCWSRVSEHVADGGAVHPGLSYMSSRTGQGE